ncbi:MAG TPA: hypothetical protein VKF36_00660 [Syntrophorhabdales bacterium]|nr:hypothetical protein [Syntrophorhabdales bacterium]
MILSPCGRPLFFFPKYKKKNTHEMTPKASVVFRVPPTSYDLQPIMSIVALQLFAYHIANRLGTDVDQPRNLAKSVTVE